MRQKSKDLIELVKTALSCLDKNNMRQKDRIDAIRLLNKFEQVEETVQKGGMIQDLNGEWCKDGDGIAFPGYSGLTLKIGETDPNRGFFYGRKAYGTLKWDYQHRKFVFKTDFFTGRDMEEYPLDNLCFYKKEEKQWV